MSAIVYKDYGNGKVKTVGVLTGNVQEDLTISRYFTFVSEHGKMIGNNTMEEAAEWYEKKHKEVYGEFSCYNNKELKRYKNVI